MKCPNQTLSVMGIVLDYIQYKEGIFVIYFFMYT